MRTKTSFLAVGKWRGLLLSAGLDGRALTGKHGPCPMCGGKDRFRFDNKKGRGTWICNQCGSGDGFDLLQRLMGWTFAVAAKFAEDLCGGIAGDVVLTGISEEKRAAELRELWKTSEPMQPGDPVDAYLQARGIQHDCPAALRFAPSCWYAPGRFFPAMVAVVSDAEGKPVSMHRTYLDGAGKANVENPRKLMPGAIPDGAAVRLAPVRETMGIAEGIETALSAAALFEINVWAAISAAVLAKWTPPQGCREVVIFGDADVGFAGQAAANTLASRLATRGIEVNVRLPPLGRDWNDVLQEELAAADQAGRVNAARRAM